MGFTQEKRVNTGNARKAVLQTKKLSLAAASLCYLTIAVHQSPPPGVTPLRFSISCQVQQKENTKQASLED